MTQRPHLLLTNDDGIHAPGLKALWETLRDDFEITIVAPCSERSGVGCSTSVFSPLYLKEHAWEQGTTVWSVSGTPVDCVKLAMHTVLKKAPDMVLAGINPGSNAGRNVFYSGTLGGAIEAVHKGLPAIALSCVSWHGRDFSLAQRFAKKLVTFFLENPLPEATLLNVNFPELANGQTFQGLTVASQGKGYFQEDPHHRTSPYGNSYYWLGSRLSETDEPQDSDVALLKQGYATLVPISLADLTHRPFADRLKSSLILD